MWRGLTVLGVLLLVLLAWFFLSIRLDLERRFGPLRELPLAGSPDVVERFAGDWYLDDALLKTRIRAGAWPSLAVRFSRRCELFAGRTLGESIVFDYECADTRGTMELVRTTDQHVVWERLGEAPSWCSRCSPRMAKSDLWRRAGRWGRILADEAKARARGAADACELWAVRNL